jgi:hypothetical protein
LQHAIADVPNRSCGYCTDDIGRALIVACDAAADPATAAGGARLVTTYLAYLHDAQLADGWFHGFMGYDRRWQDDRATEDAAGRAIWGLGYAERHAPRESWRAVAAMLRLRANDAVRRMTFVRSRAYAALGLVHALAANPADAAEVRALLDASLAPIAEAYDAHAAPGWEWCGDVLTYDNGRLCEALLRGGTALGDERYVRTGLAMLSFYASVAVEDPSSRRGQRLFVPVGNRGWYPRGGRKARDGQQPVEAAALVGAALAAVEATGDEQWRALAEVAHDWYFGRNAAHLALAAENGGCRDGIDGGALNANMGAESTVSFLLSALALERAREPAARSSRGAPAP